MQKYIIISILIYIIGSFFYGKHLISSIEILETNNEILKKTQEQNSKTIAEIKGSYDKISQINAELTERVMNSNAHVIQLESVLSKTLSKLERTALAKPTLVEDKINTKVEKNLECLESISKNEKCD